MGGKSLDPNHREPLQGSQSQQEGDNPGRQAVGSNHAGNGLSSSERSDLGGRTGGSQVETNSGEQQEVLSGVGGTGEKPNAEPEIPEEVIQEALKQQQRGRKMKEIFSLHKQGNETALDKIFLTETDPEVKEIARQLLLDLNGLPS